MNGLQGKRPYLGTTRTYSTCDDRRTFSSLVAPRSGTRPRHCTNGGTTEHETQTHNSRRFPARRTRSVLSTTQWAHHRERLALQQQRHRAGMRCEGARVPRPNKIAPSPTIASDASQVVLPRPWRQILALPPRTHASTPELWSSAHLAASQKDVRRPWMMYVSVHS